MALRILVAEDNEMNRKVISTVLLRNGFTFEIAKDGIEAVSKFEINHYDLVLMDCQMPYMDGLEAAGRIRAIEDTGKRPPCRIVALTANTMKGDREKCLAAGMNDFLAKPFKSQELMTKIRLQDVSQNETDPDLDNKSAKRNGA